MFRPSKILCLYYEKVRVQYLPLTEKVWRKFLGVAKWWYDELKLVETTLKNE